MNFSKDASSITLNLLIASIIPFLITGPFFPDLIVSTSVLFFLYFVFKNKNFYYFNKKITVIFFIFYFYCIFCSLLSDNILFSLKSSIFYFRVGIFCLVVWYLIDQNKNFLSFLYYSLILCFWALVIDGYYQYFNGENIFGIEKQSIRISSFFGDELIMGSYLSRLFPILFALFLIKKKINFEIYFVGLLFILADVLIFISGERTAFFFLNLSTVFIIILIKDFQKFRLLTFIIGIICILIVSFNSSNLFNRMFLSPAKEMGIIKSSEKKAIFSEIHDSHYKTAFNMFKDKPIFGHGPRMYRIKCADKKYSTGNFPCSTHPHNFYIQLLAETGIIGFSFLFSVFSYVLYVAIKQLKSIFFEKRRYLTDYQVCLLAGILISVWPFSPNGNFFNNWLSIVYSLPFGLYLQSVYSKREKLI